MLSVRDSFRGPFSGGVQLWQLYELNFYVRFLFFFMFIVSP